MTQPLVEAQHQNSVVEHFVQPITSSLALILPQPQH